MTAPLAILTGRLPAIAADTILRDRLVALVLPPRSLVPSALSALGARDVLLLTRDGPAEAVRHDDHVALAYRKPKSVHENNARISILHGAAVQAAMDPKVLARFDTLLVPRNWTLGLSLPAILRHARRGRLAVSGQTTIGRRAYLVLACPKPPTDNRRQYGTAGLSPLEVLRRLDGLDHVVLRWPEEIEAGRHEGDIDLLVSAADAPKVADRFADRIATYPLDVYAEDGSNGFFFAQVPYYTPSMARRMLNTAERRPSGLRVPAAGWRYLSFAYHLMLHIKSRRVPPSTRDLGPGTFRHPKYFAELQRLAAAAGEPPPATFDDIEAALRRAGAFPNTDLLGFYAEKNRFLKHRYFETTAFAPGLMTLFVRDFGAGSTPVPDVRRLIAEKFQILAEGPLTDTQRPEVETGVRGGNWSDATAPGGVAKPIHWFVCYDPSPVPPNARTRKKRPRFDNENITFKHDIRSAVGVAGAKEQRIIHTSDNTAEAIEHVELLGLAHEPHIAAVITRLTRAATERGTG